VFLVLTTFCCCSTIGNSRNKHSGCDITLQHLVALCIQTCALLLAVHVQFQFTFTRLRLFHVYHYIARMSRPNWPPSGVQDIGTKEPAALPLCCSAFHFCSASEYYRLYEVIVPVLCICLVIFLLVWWFILCSVCGCSECTERKLAVGSGLSRSLVVGPLAW
jgi:hypothetical protein